ncbi:MAG: hypothetical protein JNK46_04030 [Methylobacteriaceae bacterium]|nr:hypothetical protein [Methylobacteriaceae bacterium]
MPISRFNLLSRGKKWKAHVEQTTAASAGRLTELDARIDDLTTRFEKELAAEKALRAALEERNVILERAIAEMAELASGSTLPLDRARRVAAARRGHVIRLLDYPRAPDFPFPIGSLSGADVASDVAAGRVTRIEKASLSAEGEVGVWTEAPDLLAFFSRKSAIAHILIDELRAPAEAAKQARAPQFYEAASAALRKAPELIDFLAIGWAGAVPDQAGAPARPPEPFADADALPPFTVAAEPKVRSALFVHNSYYHFENLAEALKARGWDALTVSTEDPNSPQQQFYHGEDVNLFDPDPDRMRRKVRAFFASAPERFGAVHFYGMGMASLFPENCEANRTNARIPWDFLELRRHRTIIGYMPSGCLEGASPASIFKVSGGVCSHCVWQLDGSVCSEARSAAWIAKLDLVCDWIGLEGDWITPERRTSRHVPMPVVTALSAERWRPGLDIPDAHRIAREPGEILLYHAVGNYETRRKAGRDIKGTGAVLAAVDRLRSEGAPVKLFFATDVPSRDVRFYQAQADIVVDQLNYGRIGANAREAMMLGRPLVTSLRQAEDEGSPWIAECPALNAREDTIYDVLRDLLLDDARRRQMAKASRDFALRWHDADVCARRYEAIIERIRNGLPVDADDLRPPPLT